MIENYTFSEKPNVNGDERRIKTNVVTGGGIS
jgi:hypothetical protein